MLRKRRISRHTFDEVKSSRKPEAARRQSNDFAVRQLCLRKVTLETMAMAQAQGIKRAWSRRVEQDSLRHSDQTIKAARKVWRSLKGDTRRFDLVDEVALDRGPELTLAYRNVILVAAGFRRTTSNVGRSVLTKQPCVVFVVKAKWLSDLGREVDPQRLPSCLLAHVSLDGRRVRCAVPTDVQAQDSYLETRSMGNSILRIGNGPAAGTGHASCAVELGTAPGAKKFLLSAHHVFSHTPDVTSRTPQPGWEITPLSAALSAPPSRFAESSEWGGEMRADGQPSFDVQFAKVQDWNIARLTLHALKLSATEPYAGSAGNVMGLAQLGAFEVLMPFDNPKFHGSSRPTTELDFDSVLSDAYGFDSDVLENGLRVRRHLTFQRLIRMKLKAGLGALLEGDSGSAVVARRNDGSHTLIGMFIASGSDFAYAIPAWQLFDASYYARLPKGRPLLPVNV